MTKLQQKKIIESVNAQFIRLGLIDDGYLSVYEISQKFNISTQTINRYCINGNIDSLKGPFKNSKRIISVFNLKFFFVSNMIKNNYASIGEIIEPPDEEIKIS